MIRTALFTKVLGDRSLTEAVTIAADLGYDGLELMAQEPHFSVESTDAEAVELRDLAADHGIDIMGIASYTGAYAQHDDDEESEVQLLEFERFCELADVLGVGYIRHGPGGPSPYVAGDEHYERAARWLRRAADVAAGYGIELGIEIHGNTIVESAVDASRLIDAVNRPNVSAIHDAGNMFICGEDYGPNSVAVLDNLLGHVHIKDVRRIASTNGPGTFECHTRHGEEAFRFARMGRGDIDHWSLLHALAASGYEGYVTNECHVPVDSTAGEDIELAKHELAELERLICTAERAAGVDARA